MQVMTVEQLQKPNVATKLITKFSLTPPVSDRAGRPQAAGSRRGRPGGGGFSAAAVNPQGLAVTRVDELVVANTGDDSILTYDLEGRIIRRIHQRHLLRSRVQQDDNDRNDDGDDGRRAAAAAGGGGYDKPDNKLVM